MGSVEVGKLADLVLWTPAFFGVKPDLVIKGGTIAAAPMGDPNASIPTPQPVHYRPMFGALRPLGHGQRRALRLGRGRRRRRSTDRLGLQRELCAVRNTRGGIGKASMIHNARHARRSRSTPRPTRSAPTASCSPASPPTVLPMAQRYFLF